MPEGQGPGAHEPFDLKPGVLSGSEANLTPIRELKDYPDKVVREEVFINEDTDQTIAYYSEMKKLFEELRDSYGIAIPDIDMVVGRSEEKGDKKVFMVVDKIDGEVLKSLRDSSKEVGEKFEIFCINLMRSMFNAYKDSRPFFNDVTQRNIMYGHKSKEKDAENQFFIADVGDGFWRRDQIDYDPKEYDQHFFDQIDDMVTLIKHNEKKFGESTTFKFARLKLKEIYSYLRDVKVKELEENMIELPKDFDSL